MSYNQIAAWLKGYLDALQSNEEVTKDQLQTIIDRVQEMISKAEEQKGDEEVASSAENDQKKAQRSDGEPDDDLPF
jgi:hypothetical protein